MKFFKGFARVALYKTQEKNKMVVECFWWVEEDKNLAVDKRCEK